MWVQVAIKVLFQALPLCLLVSTFAEDAPAVFFISCFNGHSLRSSCSATDCRSLLFIFFYLFQLWIQPGAWVLQTLYTSRLVELFTIKVDLFLLLFPRL